MEVELAEARREVDDWLAEAFPVPEGSADEAGIPNVFETGQDGADSPFLRSSENSEVAPDSQERDKTVKAVKVLTFLCSEVQILEHFARKRFYPVLYVVGDRIVRGSTSPMGESELQMASLIPTLQDVSDFLEQMESLLSNLFCQIGAVCKNDQLILRRGVLRVAFDSVGRGLVVLLTVQMIVALKILPLFFNYRRMLHTMMSKSDRHTADLGLLEEVLEQVVRLEETIKMSAFTAFLDSHVKRGNVGEVLRSRRVSTMVESYIRDTIGLICPRLDTLQERYWDRCILLGVLVLFVTHCSAGAYARDRKLLRVVLEVHQKCPLLPLSCNLIVNPSRFLEDMLPSYVLSLLPWDMTRQANAQSSAHLKNILSVMESKLEVIAFRGSVWSTELCATAGQGRDSLDPNEKCRFFSLLLEGLKLLVSVKEMVKNVIQLHVEQLEPMNKIVLRKVTNCICYLKLLWDSLSKCWVKIREERAGFMDHCRKEMLNHMESAKEAIEHILNNAGTSKVSKVLSQLGANVDKTRDRLQSCATLLEIGIRGLEGPPSLPQRLLVKFVLDTVSAVRFVPKWIITVGQQHLKCMEDAEQIMEMLEDLGKCEFLYFHPEFMRNAFQDVYLHPEEARKLPHLIDSFLDVRVLVEQAGFGSAARVLENEVNSLLHVHLLHPLSRLVEKDLFDMVQKKTTRGENFNGNVLPVLKLPPLRLIMKEVNPAQYVSEHLSKALRRLTVRGVLEWKVLCRLRNLAYEKYGLAVEQIEPAYETTKSPLDNIASMDGLRRFITSFMFNLHSHTFVINPRTVASSSNDWLPEMVGINQFTQLIEADITQVGARALEAFVEKTEDKKVPSPQQESNEPVTHEIEQAPIVRSKSGGDLTLKKDVNGRVGETVDGEPSTSGGFVDALEGLRRAVSGSGLTSLEGSVGSDKVQWSVMRQSPVAGAKKSWKGSGNSLEALPSGRGEHVQKGRVSMLVDVLHVFIHEKIKELVDLCSAPETRSVFSQTTQRWNNSRKAVGHQYPVAQAELVRKEVIGLLKAGTLSLNPLQRLRFHIVDLGKAVALVMTLFHATAQFREQTLALLPRSITHSFDTLNEFLAQIGAPDSVVQLGNGFDEAVNGFAREHSVRVQYMKLLTSAFEEVMENDRVNCLQALFVLAPALTLDHVESMRSLKGQYRGAVLPSSSTITDDSFAVGLSYLLAMVGQVEKFHALHWFDSTHRHYHSRLNRLQAASNGRGSQTVVGVRRTDTDLMENLQGMMSELRLLENSLSCAGLIFRNEQSGV